MHKSVQITTIIVVGIILLSLIGIYKLSPASDTIESKATTSSEANQLNSEIVEKLTTNILALGFEEKNIITENFNVYPNNEWINGKMIPKGYVATHSIKIEMSTSETQKIGQVIDAGVNAGAGISYINFELSPEKQSEAKAEAIKLAAQDAKVQAQALADGLDKKVGKLVSVSLDDFNYYPWRVYSASGVSEDAMMAKEATTNIQPGDKEISARVSAVYKIR
ncbi:SIMPL domain-containing protein [Candidatus Pacearchaeota archaeon]|nr:SIMPL domain-containing protein [Candidatus Pacearchaeota archaeon]